jgi:glycosyltransferase involved in cell wall biosynthesis
MEKKLVSIIIPVYNRENVIARNIYSAINQTFQNIEVICIDNCSTDKTWEMIQLYAKADKRIKIFRNESNIGPVRNWKKGLEMAEGNYIKYLWSDDVIAPTCVEKMVKILDENMDVGFVYSCAQIRNDENEIKKTSYILRKTGKYPTNYYIQSISLDYGNVPVSPGCALCRIDDATKNIIINVDNNIGLDFPKYGAGNDALFFMEACLDYDYFYYINESLSTFYAGTDSLTTMNDLSIYYDYTIYSFLQKHKIKYTKIWNRYMSLCTIHKRYNFIRNEKHFKFDILFLITRLFLKIMKYFRNIFKNNNSNNKE